MSEPVIAVENLARVYRVGDIDVRALGGVSLRIERGEFVAIMGSSGSASARATRRASCPGGSSSASRSLAP